jgi:tetratricopeptide (TPR) repeat protein
LVDLAIGLGGDAPLRRIRSSRHHFHAGNYGHARALLEPCIRELQPGPLLATAVALLAEMRMYHNSFAQAASMLHHALKDAESDRALLVQTLILLSFARINTGEYERSLHNARQAVALTDELDVPALSSQACAMWVTVNLMCGQGVDTPRLQRALKVEDRDADVPIPFGASTVNALVLAWTGRLDDARAQVSSVRNRCIERGEYGHLMFIDLHSTLIEVWRGNFTDAAQIAKDAMERAEQLGGDHALVIADAIGAVVAAYAGREQEARTHDRAAIEKARDAQAHSCLNRKSTPVAASALTRILNAVQVRSDAVRVFETRSLLCTYCSFAVETYVGHLRRSDLPPRTALGFRFRTSEHPALGPAQ